ncbi:MAG: hypothetical protein WC878_04295 [Candidatus Paceibacterota bacterium]|jgi:hypothetical protein
MNNPPINPIDTGIRAKSIPLPNDNLRKNEKAQPPISQTITEDAKTTYLLIINPQLN